MRIKTLAVITAAFLSASVARAQTGRTWTGGGAAAGSAMVKHDGKIYALTGALLVRLDAQTLEVEAKRDLTKTGKTAEEKAAERKEREDYLARYDANGNGELTAEELGRRRYLLYRYDKNGDGKLAADEMTFLGRSPRAAVGDVTLLVDAGKLYMLRSGSIFVFDLATLELKGATEIVPKPVARPRTPRVPATAREPATPKPVEEKGADDAF